MHVVTKPSLRPFSESVLTQATYCKLKPGFSKVTVCLHDNTTKEIKIPMRTIIGQVQAKKTGCKEEWFSGNEGSTG